MLSHVWLFTAPWIAAYQASLSMGFSRQEYWSGFPWPTQEIFLTQGSNPHLSCLLLQQVDSLPLAALGSPPVQFSSVQSLRRVRLSVTPCIAARQASLSITNSQSLLKLMSIESVMPSGHLILCHPLLLLPPPPFTSKSIWFYFKINAAISHYSTAMSQRDLFVSCLDYSNSLQMASSFHLIPLLSLLYKEARGIFSWTKLLNMYFIKTSCPYITTAQLSKSRQSNWPSTTIQSTVYSLCINCPNNVLS